MNYSFVNAKGVIYILVTNLWPLCPIIEIRIRKCWSAADRIQENPESDFSEKFLEQPLEQCENQQQSRLLRVALLIQGVMTLTNAVWGKPCCDEGCHENSKLSLHFLEMVGDNSSIFCKCSIQNNIKLCLAPCPEKIGCSCHQECQEDSFFFVTSRQGSGSPSHLELCFWNTRMSELRCWGSYIATELLK